LLTEDDRWRTARAARRIQLQTKRCLQQALDTARSQKAKVLELRAAVCLSRLWQPQGKRHAAQQLLAGVYAWFTEGIESVDLQEAKTLLTALAD
jgi:hypothetical protein